MSRTDFVSLAGDIKWVRDFHGKYAHEEKPEERAAAIDAIDHVARHVADTCARANGNFDRNRFLVACGIGSEAA